MRGHLLVSASEDHGGAVWHRGVGDVALMSVWTERRPGHGEDAEPLVLHHRPSAHTAVGVFDGAGGAGSATAGADGGGVPRSGAWLASRMARATAQEWYRGTQGDSRDRTGDSLRRALAGRFEPWRGSGARRKIVGSMRRELPTTLAVVDQWADGRTVGWRAFWAGDSRCYLLTPDGGLQQLTVDDTDTPDALAALVEDPPMTNLVCADRPFRINMVSGGADTPCVVLCATDGYFGYVHTPADFEHVLLTALRQATGAAQWPRLLGDAVRAYTADDASLALAAHGFGDFRALQLAFARRLTHLTDHHRTPVELAAGDREAYLAARSDSWVRYREGYERRLPGAAEEGTR